VFYGLGANKNRKLREDISKGKREKPRGAKASRQEEGQETQGRWIYGPDNTSGYKISGQRIVTKSGESSGSDCQREKEDPQK